MYYKSLINLAFIFNCLLSFSQHNNDISIGFEEKIYCSILNEQRELLISIPKNKLDTSKKYPLLICLDADYRFNVTQGICQYLGHFKKVPEMIIVGVKHKNRFLRMRDLLPTNCATDYIGDTIPALQKYSGKASDFSDFIEHELLTYLDSIYPNISMKVLLGHSAGGLFTSYVFSTKPYLFDSYICSDPSFGYDNKVILDILKNNLKKDYKNKTVYLSLSKTDYQDEKLSKIGEIQKDSLEEFYKLLCAYPKKVNCHFEEFEDEHIESYICSLKKGLIYVFETANNY